MVSSLDCDTANQSGHDFHHHPGNATHFSPVSDSMFPRDSVSLLSWFISVFKAYSSVALENRCIEDQFFEGMLSLDLFDKFHDTEL